jgi:hypothetical protein
MPYNPTVNDRSGEILGEYTANAANIRAQGMANMGQSIGEGLQSAGSSIAGGMTKMQENKAKTDTNQGVAQALAETYRTYGTTDQYNNYIAGVEKYAGNQDKLAGWNAVNMKTADHLMAVNQAQETYTARGNAYLGRPPASPNLSVTLGEGVNIWD